MSTPARVLRQSSGGLAATHIKRLIWDQQLRPGDRVPQDEVAAALGISRIPVREALIALEREGLITIEMHRGAFVNDLDEQAVRDHYALFGMVYGFAVRRALGRDHGPLAEKLAGILGDLSEDASAPQAGHVALAFHAAVVKAARSPRIVTILGAMSGLVPGNFFAEVPGTIAVEFKGLHAIVRAARKGDGDAAARHYERMLQAHGDLVVDLLRSRGFWA